MRKSRTHILDTASNTLWVAYPVRLCTRLDVEAVATDQRIFLRSEASRDGVLPSRKRVAAARPVVEAAVGRRREAKTDR